VDSLTRADELLFGLHGKIERFGWTGMYVFDDPETRTPGWGYTIGLADRVGHPELVVVGLDHCCVGELLDVLANRATAGERFDDLPDGRFDLEGHPFRVVPVHRSHWATDRFNMWLAYYGLLGEGMPPQDALQVLWPDDDDRLPGDPAHDRRDRRLQTRLDRRTRQPRDRPRRAA
jgi:hypothetical protein